MSTVRRRGLQIDDRRAHERELFGEYFDALLGHGVEGIDSEGCWSEYRRLTFGGILMAIVASMLVERTDRGDEMFMAMLARHSQQAEHDGQEVTRKEEALANEPREDPPRSHLRLMNRPSVGSMRNHG